jgi:hypothetical protein
MGRGGSISSLIRSGTLTVLSTSDSEGITARIAKYFRLTALEELPAMNL